MSKPDSPSRPHYYEALRLRGIRCFDDATIPLGPKVTVILGGNGSGKTTVVEALASLTDGDDEGLSEFPLRRKARSGEVALISASSNRAVARWKFSPKAESRKRLPPERYLFAYGRYRRVFTPSDPDLDPERWNPSIDLERMSANAALRRTWTLNRPDNNLLRDLSRYLGALDFGREFDPRLEHAWNDLVESIKKLGQNIDGIERVKRKTRTVPMIVRSGLPLEIRELSDGYQSLLVVVLDLVMRYSTLFKDAERPLEGEALVAIDEVDLHLHPRWQRIVTQQLTELFPNTQFVLTTHSPAVVQGAIDLGMMVVTHTEENGAVVPRTLSSHMMRKLKGAEIGSLLTQERLFDVESRYSPKFEEVESKVDDLQAKVESGQATDAEYRELSKHLATLQQLVAKDDELRADGSAASQLSEMQTAFVDRLIDRLTEKRS